jgi:hypothetical protein
MPASRIRNRCKVATLVMLAAFFGANPAAHAQCRKMADTSGIPKGWHPVTAQWQPGEPDKDIVCINKTEGKEIQVLAWKGFSLPDGYYVLSSESSVNPQFRGCAQWSSYQGVNTCMTSWTVYRLRKNP